MKNFTAIFFFIRKTHTISSFVRPFILLSWLPQQKLVVEQLVTTSSSSSLVVQNYLIMTKQNYDEKRV